MAEVLRDRGPVPRLPGGGAGRGGGLLRRRLLLCLFALGTNMGIRQMATTGEHAEDEGALRRVRASHITRDNLRAAIVKVVNATFAARDPHWWGKATSTASHSKRFGSWDSNLMTQFHARYGSGGIMIYGRGDRGQLHRHGASVVGFAFTELRGFKLPRLKNIGSIRLYSPDDGPATWPRLERVVKNRPITGERHHSKRALFPVLATSRDDDPAA